jgi:hypothetical protein
MLGYVGYLPADIAVLREGPVSQVVRWLATLQFACEPWTARKPYQPCYHETDHVPHDCSDPGTYQAGNDVSDYHSDPITNQASNHQSDDVSHHYSDPSTDYRTY